MSLCGVRNEILKHEGQRKDKAEYVSSPPKREKDIWSYLQESEVCDMQAGSHYASKTTQKHVDTVVGCNAFK